nr:MAG TPA: hypothetical protein [Caudoviricetes sp.]
MQKAWLYIKEKIPTRLVRESVFFIREISY